MTSTNRDTLDVSSASTSAIGFNTAVKIMTNWGCKNDDMTHILRINRASFFKYKAAKSPFSLDRDQLTRISYVLNIHAALRTCFSNPENVTGFMTMENHNPYFDGRKPLDIIKKGSFPDLHEVFCRLDSMRSGGW